MDLLAPEELAALGQSYGRSMRKMADMFMFRRTSHQQPFPWEKRDSSAPAKGPAKEGLDSAVKVAFARELLRLNAITPFQAVELAKAAAVTTEQARRSLDRLDTLERNKPTLGQVGRYGGIGALGGAAAGAVGNAIEHGSALKGATPKAKVLNLAASAAKGAIGGGALPLLRSHSDRRAETGTLRKFMQEGSSA